MLAREIDRWAALCPHELCKRLHRKYDLVVVEPQCGDLLVVRTILSLSRLVM
jgi:hypothetical protein